MVEPLTAADEELGAWLWAMQDARRRTLEELEHLDGRMLDWQPAPDASSIGTILYHMALIEADWLYEEVLVQPYPAEAQALLPIDHRDSAGQLSVVQGWDLPRYLELLQTVRGWLLATFQQLDSADFRRPRALPAYDVTPQWVLHHLLQHEAEHRGQLRELRTAAERAMES